MSDRESDGKRRIDLFTSMYNPRFDVWDVVGIIVALAMFIPLAILGIGFAIVTGMW